MNSERDAIVRAYAGAKFDREASRINVDADRARKYIFVEGWVKFYGDFLAGRLVLQNYDALNHVLHQTPLEYTMMMGVLARRGVP